VGAEAAASGLGRGGAGGGSGLFVGEDAFAGGREDNVSVVAFCLVSVDFLLLGWDALLLFCAMAA